MKKYSLIFIFLVFAYFISLPPTKKETIYSVKPPLEKLDQKIIGKGVSHLCRIYPSKYKESFKHFDYVNPNAPKGGTLKLATVGSFDKINPFTVKGRVAYGDRFTSDPLMFFSLDEPFCQYAMLASSVRIDKNRMTFYIRPNAYFHSGLPVKAEDIEATVEILKVHGAPKYKHYYNMIEKINVRGSQEIEFILSPEKLKNFPLLPYVIAGIRPISKHQLDQITEFENFHYEPLITSGPYFVESFEIGKRIVFRKNPHYWGKDLPINTGKYNFDKIQIDYYKDEVSLFESFKKGYFDAYFDTDPRHFERVKLPNENFVKLNFKNDLPVAVQSLVFNMRNPIFKDPRIRKAITMAFDFKKINQMFFNNHLKQARSLFENTNFAKHVDRDLNKHEKKLLKNIDSKDKFFERGVSASMTVEQLLEEAGYHYDKQHKFRVDKNGNELKIRVLIRKRKFEKIMNVFREDLEKIGVRLHIVFAEESLYRQFENNRNYDMVMVTWCNKRLPGIEQTQYFSQKSANQKGSQNYMCLEDPVAEKLAEYIANAKNKDDLEASVTLLDRYVINKNYVILMDYSPSVRMIYRKDRFDFMADPNAGIDIMSCGWSVGHNLN